MNRARKEALDHFQKKYKLHFKNKELLNEALTHRSWCNESGSKDKDNQRLEYLGDSVLGLIINHYLYTNHPKFKEGELSKLKSAIVSAEPLTKIAKQLDLGELLLLGKGEKHSGGQKRSSNLADALEALVAAIYLDQNLAVCTAFVTHHFKDLLESKSDPDLIHDSKTTLQEFLQKKGLGLPTYKVISSVGPDHKKHFEVAVLVQKKPVAKGQGTTIKKAQIQAASVAYQKLSHSHA